MVRLEVPGVLIDVDELLRSLHADELYICVNSALHERPQVRQQLIEAWKCNRTIGFDTNDISSRSSSIRLPTMQDSTQEMAVTPFRQEEAGSAEGPQVPQPRREPEPLHDDYQELLASWDPMPKDWPAKEESVKGDRQPEPTTLGRREETSGDAVGPSLQLSVERIDPSTQSAGGFFGKWTRRPDDLVALSEKLAEAVGRADLGSARRLIDERADVNHVTSDGSCPAALATMQGRPPALLQLLLESKASVRLAASASRDISLVHIWGTAEMHTRRLQEEARAKLRLLVTHRADLDARVRLSGDAPLHLAAEEFQRRRAETRRSRKPSPEGHHKTLGIQCQCQLLLQARADPGVKNLMNKTPLDLVDPEYRRELFAGGRTFSDSREQSREFSREQSPGGQEKPHPPRMEDSPPDPEMSPKTRSV